jgi:tetratricopeptide (TPR) repeat protein
MIRRGAVLALLLLFVAFAEGQDDLRQRAATAESSGHLKDAFSLYLTAWRQLPPDILDDVGLRKSLITVAAQLDPPPEVPEAALRHDERARMRFAQSKRIEDFLESAEEFRLAIREAPWWPDAAFNLALALDHAEEYDQAIQNLDLYIASMPSDMQAARRKRLEIEIHAERAPGTVIFFREHRGFVGSAGVVHFEIDGIESAVLQNGTYARVRVSSGEPHAVYANDGQGHSLAPLPIKLRPKDVRYVHVALGIRPRLEEVDATRGAKAIASLKMVVP